jgi:hypothetical protein
MIVVEDPGADARLGPILRELETRLSAVPELTQLTVPAGIEPSFDQRSGDQYIRESPALYHRQQRRIVPRLNHPEIPTDFEEWDYLALPAPPEERDDCPVPACWVGGDLAAHLGCEYALQMDGGIPPYIEREAHLGEDVVVL